MIISSQTDCCVELNEMHRGSIMTPPCAGVVPLGRRGKACGLRDTDRSCLEKQRQTSLDAAPLAGYGRAGVGHRGHQRIRSRPRFREAIRSSASGFHLPMPTAPKFAPQRASSGC